MDESVETAGIDETMQVAHHDVTPHIRTAAVSREVSQARLDRKNAPGTKHKASQTYCIAERFEEIVAEHGRRRAIIYGEQTLSYAELDARVNQAAHALHALGVRCGDVVAVCLENRPAFLFAWLGLMKVGAVGAFLNTNVSGKPLAHALAATQASRIIVGEECLGLFDDPQTLGAQASVPLWWWPDPERPATAEQRTRCVLDLSAQVAAASPRPPPATWRAGLTAGQPAMYIFTSGTTGLPKAAVVSHARWLTTGDVMQVTLDLGPADCFYTFLPLYHAAASVAAAATAMAAGASLLLRRKFSRSAFWSDVRKHRVTACQYVSEICRFLLTAPEQPDDREHTLQIMLGSGLASETWEQWTRRFGEMNIFEGWGSTEANTNVANLDNRVGSCGRVPDWSKTNLRLVRYDSEMGEFPRDAEGWYQLAGIGEAGVALGMIIDIPDVMAGRFEGYTSAEATEKKILRNVFKKGDAWWFSGDLIRCDADGYCWFVDRVGDTFRWNSENVSTTEVGDELGDFPGMDAITVYGVKVPEHDGRAGMGAIVMQDGHSFDPVAFYAFAMQRLPRYAAPVFVRVTPQVQMTGNYKLRKVDLQREGFDASVVKDPLFVRDDAAGCYVPLTPDALHRVLGI